MVKKIFLSEMICFVIVITCAFGQNCMNSAGEPVSWWVVLKVPPTTGNSGYGYYDSNTKTGEFSFVNKTIDQDISALTQTLSLINKNTLERVAWNDEKPNNQTSTIQAHSKGLIAYSRTAGKGFYIVHSIPKYPAFLDNHTINMTIGKSQQIFGQHIACFSLSLYELNNLAYFIQTIHPFIYQSVVTLTVGTQHIYDLGKGDFPPLKQLFQYYQMSPVNYTITAIFKTNILNGSIFEDGLTNMLKDGGIIAETWGRPIQQPWCSKDYQVQNVRNITLNKDIKWNEQEDHSKWAISQNKYSCFGDMNRMPSQWTRGGAFFCLSEPTLHDALKKIIQATDNCPAKNFVSIQKQKLINLLRTE